MIFMLLLRESRWRKSSLVQGAAKMQMLPVTLTRDILKATMNQQQNHCYISLAKKNIKKCKKCNIFTHFFSATAVLVASAPITRGHYRRNLTCSTKWTKHVLPQTGNLVSVANDQTPSKKDYCTLGKI